MRWSTPLVIAAVLILFVEGKKEAVGEVDGKVIDNDEDLAKSLGVFAQDFSESPKIKPDAPKPKKYRIKYDSIQSDAFQGSMFRFLDDYGYIEVVKKKTKRQMEKAGSLVSEAEGDMALKNLQKRYGLKPTGQFDEQTIKLLSDPRCGVKDVFYKEDEYDGETLNRAKRYALSQKKWPKPELFYWYNPDKMTKDMPEKNVKEVIERALKKWASVSSVSFYETTTEDFADIKMSFDFGDHGDGYPFTGEGQALAHAFYPVKGQLHFDDAERFTDGIPSGINLYFTATHELGHILGIKHSTVKDAVMFPYYPGYSDEIKLDQDDIDAIHQAIGPGKGKVVPAGDDEGTDPPVEPTTLPDSPPDCWDKLDGVLRYEGRETIVYVFSGHWYFRLKALNPSANNYLPVYDSSVPPKLIKENFKGVPSNIDGVVPGIRNTKNLAYFVKDDTVYEFSFADGKVTKQYAMAKFFKEVSKRPEIVNGGWKIKKTETGFLSNSSFYIYDDVTGSISGPKDSYFKTGHRIDAISQTFYNVWTWIFQGKYYGIAKSTNGVYSRSRVYRPIRKDLKIPMCEEEVGELNEGEKKKCNQEYKKYRKATQRGTVFTPSLTCYNYILKRLKPNNSKLPNLS